MLLPIPDISVQVGLLMKVEVVVGSLDQEFGIFMTSLPPEGIWFLGVRLKVKGE